MDGALLSENTRSLTVAPNASRNVYSADISGLFARLRPQSGDRRRGIHDRRTPLRQHLDISSLKKSLELPEADIRWSAGPAADGYEITLSSDRFVRAVWLALDGNEHFEDNYFDLVPGVSKTVRVATTLSRSEFDSAAAHHPFATNPINRPYDYETHTAPFADRRAVARSASACSPKSSPTTRSRSSPTRCASSASATVSPTTA